MQFMPKKAHIIEYQFKINSVQVTVHLYFHVHRSERFERRRDGIEIIHQYKSQQINQQARLLHIVKEIHNLVQTRVITLKA